MEKTLIQTAIRKKVPPPRSYSNPGFTGSGLDTPIHFDLLMEPLLCDLLAAQQTLQRTLWRSRPTRRLQCSLHVTFVP